MKILYWIRSLLAAFGLAGVSAAGAQSPPEPEPATSDRFEVGQVWEYATRPQDAGSKVMIGRIETIPDHGPIVHVKLVGLRVENPHAPGGISTEIGHIPIDEPALRESATELTGEAADLSGLDDGYSTWLAAYREDGAGVFSIPLADVVDVMEATLRE